MNDLSEAQSWVIVFIVLVLVSFALSYFEIDPGILLDHPATFGPL